MNNGQNQPQNTNQNPQPTNQNPQPTNTEINPTIRGKIIQEIIETERLYVNDLVLIQDVFYQPLKEKGIISEEEQRTLFANLLSLIPLNQQKVMLPLEQRLEYTTSNQIPIWNLTTGDIFVELSEHLKEYTDYCSNQPNSLALLEKLTLENNDFEKFTTDVMNNETKCRGLSMLSFIIKPVQRLCKYPLLLRELIKMTDPNDEEYKKLQTAITKVNVTVEFVNEMQRKSDERKQQLLGEIINIEDSIEGGEILELASDKNRTLLKSGEINIVLNAKNKKLGARAIYLFNNLIVITVPLKKGKKGKKNKLIEVTSKLETFLHLKNATVVDISNTEFVSNAFMLKDRSNDLEQTLFCDDLDTKNLWIKYIRNTIKVYQKQEALKKKSYIAEGKEQSIALSVQVQSTSKILKGDNRVQDVQSRLRNVALPVFSLQTITNISNVLGKGTTSVPFFNDQSVPPPPVDDGDLSWKEKQRNELSWLKKSTNGEWLKIEGGPKEYYYNIPKKAVSYALPQGIVF